MHSSQVASSPKNKKNKRRGSSLPWFWRPFALPNGSLRILIAVANHAKNDASSNKVPLFLVGSSMGGAIALAVAKKLNDGKVQGVVMLAPMLSLKVSFFERGNLEWLCGIQYQNIVRPSSLYRANWGGKYDVLFLRFWLLLSCLTSDDFC